MDFLDLAKRRHSVRTFKRERVGIEDVQRILESARVAPTAANKQPVRLVVAQDPDTLSRLSKTADLYGAPLAILVCADKTRAWVRPSDGKSTSDIDAAIACDHMMMEATSLDLGSVWICWFDAEAIRKELDLPDELEPVNILAIGYSAESPSDPNRFARDRISVDRLTNIRR
ncbi:MAG: nitroreductase family protein [Eggerthellaceae bacterium]